MNIPRIFPALISTPLEDYYNRPYPQIIFATTRQKLTYKLHRNNKLWNSHCLQCSVAAPTKNTQLILFCSYPFSIDHFCRCGC